MLALLEAPFLARLIPLVFGFGWSFSWALQPLRPGLGSAFLRVSRLVSASSRQAFARPQDGCVLPSAVCFRRGIDFGQCLRRFFQRPSSFVRLAASSGF